jgi:hypothetical protein
LNSTKPLQFKFYKTVEFFKISLENSSKMRCKFKVVSIIFFFFEDECEKKVIKQKTERHIWIHVVLKIIINLLSDSLAFVESHNDEHRKALSISKSRRIRKHVYLYRIVDWGDQRNAIIIMNEWISLFYIKIFFWIWWVCFYLWRKLNEKFIFSQCPKLISLKKN